MDGSSNTMDEFTIAVEYGETFREEVIDENNADPYSRITIKSCDEYLYGSSNRAPKNWVTYLINSFLETVQPVVDGKKDVVTNHNGPSYFVLEPEGESAVRCTHVLRQEGIDDPAERLPEAKSTNISIESYVNELVSVGETHLKQLLELNPQLEDDGDVRHLRSNIETAKSIDLS